MTGDDRPFWERKPLAGLTKDEWESLCDGCGRCCLVKLEDDDTAEVHVTRLACKLLDIGTCRCKDYENRQSIVHDCLSIDLQAVRNLTWLPVTCAYRRIDEGRGLAWWHPLVSGTQETVHQAGISVRTLARSEKGVRASAVHKYIIPPLGDDASDPPAFEPRCPAEP